MRKNKEVFTVKGENGEEIELAALRPTPKQTVESQKVYNKTYAQGKRDGYLFRDELWDAMEKQGLWDTEKQKMYNDIEQRLSDNIEKLNKGGISKKEGKTLSLSVKIDRMLLQQLLADRVEMDAVTVEGTADNARFDYLVSVCIVYNTNGQAYFTSLDDYLARSTEQASIKAANTLAALINDSDPNYHANLPENKFLKRFGYVNEDYRLVNDKGELVDTLGRRINDKGELIDDEGNVVDKDGQKVVVSDVDTAEFFDDEDDTKVEEEPKVAETETKEEVVNVG